MKTKTKISAELLLASKNVATGDILYTFKLTYPRIILPEVLNHRCFSRSTSSTRAIPTIKMIRAVWSDPFIPSYIGTSQRGMQAGPLVSGWRKAASVAVWHTSSYLSCACAFLLTKMGVAKEIAGRLIEPYSWVTQIVSGTDWDNFFNLRISNAAEPHICHLARCIRARMIEAECPWPGYVDIERLQAGGWHLPLLKHEERRHPQAKLISAARCARISYTVVGDGKQYSAEDDIKLANRLLESLHLSPFEHQAQAMETSAYCANFRGWSQFRKELEGAK